MDLEELTSSSADSPASLGHKPGSSEAQKMTAISGRRWLALLQSCDLNISLARMCEALLGSPWASSAAFLTWRASGIKPSHLLFQLAPLTPRIEETGSGLWPTPKATDGSISRTAAGAARELARGKNIDLGMVAKLWPSPQARDWKGPSGRSLKNQENDLPNAVKMWPTPTASDHKGSGPTVIRKDGKNRLNDRLDYATEQRQQGAGSLNPTWVEWLMGFPAGWSSLTVEELRPELKTASLDLKPSEMPLCRKSSSRSDGRSSRRKKANE